MRFPVSPFQLDTWHRKKRLRAFDLKATTASLRRGDLDNCAPPDVGHNLGRFTKGEGPFRRSDVFISGHYFVRKSKDLQSSRWTRHHRIGRNHKKRPLWNIRYVILKAENISFNDWNHVTKFITKSQVLQSKAKNSFFASRLILEAVVLLPLSFIDKDLSIITDIFAKSTHIWSCPPFSFLHHRDTTQFKNENAPLSYFCVFRLLQFQTLYIHKALPPQGPLKPITWDFLLKELRSKKYFVTNCSALNNRDWRD